jgi:N-acetylneuraminate synthase
MKILKNIKKTIVIAEACENHFGKISNAIKMIDFAKKSGADYIKFQHHIPDEEMLKKVPRSKNFSISLYNFLKKYSFKIEDHKILMNYCKKKKIKYLCTPFSLKAAQELNNIGLDMFKIGSGEFNDLPMISEILKFNKPIIFSTGMSNTIEIKKMYDFIKKKTSNFAFLNCTSEYPPLNKDLNLSYIKVLKKKFRDIVIGHSDHTNNIYSSIVAVSFGAKIIEKHVNLDNLNFGPDKDVSITFAQLSELIKAIKIVEESIGYEKKLYKNEMPIFKWARRSIVSIQDINKGEKLTEKNIFSKRPALGISSYNYYKLLGKKVNKNIRNNSIIKYKDII